LQRRDAFAFEVSLSCSSEDRLGGKTVLNPESILHDPSQPVVLNFCHASKITNESPNRKLKNPGPLKQGRAGHCNRLEFRLQAASRGNDRSYRLKAELQTTKKRRGFLARAVVPSSSGAFVTRRNT
jgi:hypothetical protein